MKQLLIYIVVLVTVGNISIMKLNYATYTFDQLIIAVFHAFSRCRT